MIWIVSIGVKEKPSTWEGYHTYFSDAAAISLLMRVGSKK